ncbi:hypothetical protein Lalb_Chr16g0383511 [Lupinus albus]|uniref:Uncharacterized protein n=1 Tax=Lupinus albus TaxID=3870 RepID=A0A6A4P3A2_LUPAL|nr:hypothetical protein Lalb_Chr16g0383511 [Lupinus albus]
MASTLLLVVVFVLDLILREGILLATLVQDAGGIMYCQYDSDIATGLGVGSFFVLVTSQVIIMIVTRCFCCGKAMTPSGSRSWAIFLFIFSWYFP